MPITRINYGSAPDDGTGDPLRVAFKKTDDNFVDLDTRKAEQQDVADALATKVDKVANQRLMTSEEGTKLAGIATGATANSTDAYLLNRANHTGTQPASTITGLSVGASFTTVPTTNQGPSIVVTAPHLRFMVWNGTKYVRAPWHAPGKLSYFLRDVPAGYVEVRSDVVLNTADFPDLAEYLGVTAATFVLDEARGEFLRALDSGRGKDAGRVVGSHQGDAGRNLTGQTYSTFSGRLDGGMLATFNSGAFRAMDSGVSASSVGGEFPVDNTNRGLVLDASLQWPTANEFRVTNLAYRLAVQY